MKFRTLALVPVLASLLLGMAACGGGKSSDNNSSASSAATTAPMSSGGETQSGGGSMQSGGSMGSTANATIPNCGAVQAVWVNLRTKVYHEPGDQFYGKTAHGEYLCPSAAKAQGFHPAGGAMKSHKHSTM